MIVKWKEAIKVTDSGITLDNPQVIERRGELLSSTPLPMQNGQQIAFAVVLVVRRLDTNQIVAVMANDAKIEEPEKLLEVF